MVECNNQNTGGQAMKFWTKTNLEYETCMYKYFEMFFSSLQLWFFCDQQPQCDDCAAQVAHSSRQVQSARRKYWFVCIASKNQCLAQSSWAGSAQIKSTYRTFKAYKA